VEQATPARPRDATLRVPADAPAWMQRLLLPMLARHLARQLLAENRGTDTEVLVERMRADTAAAGVHTDDLLRRVQRNLAAGRQRNTRTARSPLPSALVLVLANLVPLYGVLFLDWPVFPLLVLFWLENVVVGAMNALRMLAIDPLDPVLWLGKAFLVPFFCVHYGGFTFGHGVFVFSLFGQAGSDDLFGVSEWVAQVTALGLWWPAAALLASHLFSFGWNYLWRGEFRLASLQQQMMQPYRRVIVLHLTIIFGGGAAMVLGSPLWALLLMLALKIAVDLRAHLAEHRSHDALAPAPTGN